MKTVVVIPTIDPDERLAKLIDDLRFYGLSRFIVVDDGSKPSCDELFGRLEQDGVRVIHHEKNLGKGSALKTGFASVGEFFPEATHVVTADDDGQHLARDIVRVVERADGRHDHVTIGVRDLGAKSVPLRSRLGNAFSSAYFRFDTGLECPDTQTGLRAIPVDLIPYALSVPGERYEYEMNFLTDAAKRGMPIQMVPIATVYHANNAGSHFSTVRDSLRIYRQLARFGASSLACATIDLGLFACIAAFVDLDVALIAFVATVAARVVSGVANFSLNRYWSFRDSESSKGDAREQAWRYFALFVAQMLSSAGLVAALSATGAPLVAIKVLVDSVLFVISYFMQRNWVFTKTAKPKAPSLEGGHGDVSYGSAGRYLAA